jgi:APA family basic amino acid/polyamine antiporter
VTTDPGRIEPRLSAFDAAMVVVSLVIGIGIFRTPAVVAREAGSSAAFFGAWVVGGVVSLLGALTYAEIGSRLPRAGGYYKVVAECYHPRLAFMLNWSQAVMQGAGAAGVAFIGAEYLAGALRVDTGAVPPLAAALMVVLLALNWLGVRTGARTQNVLSLAKIVMIAGVALLAFTRADMPAPTGGGPAGGGWAFASALVAVFYTYGGYQTAMNLGGDLRDPRRNLPRAVVGGMLLVVALYLLANAAYLRVLGLSGVAESTLVAAALLRALFGPLGETLVSLLIFLSAAGFVNATILQVPRSFYAMAQDGALPRAFLRIDARTQVQPAGLLFFGASMLLPALVLGSFEKLLAYVMFSDGLMLLVVASTIFVLRRRRADDEARVFRVPGYPLVPALFLLALSGVVVRLVWVETPLALAGSLVLATGAPLYSLARRASGA